MIHRNLMSGVVVINVVVVVGGDRRSGSLMV